MHKFSLIKLIDFHKWKNFYQQIQRFAKHVILTKHIEAIEQDTLFAVLSCDVSDFLKGHALIPS